MDPRNTKLAEQLIDYSVELKPGEKIYLEIKGIEAYTSWVKANEVELAEPYTVEIKERSTLEIEILATDPEGGPLTYSAFLDTALAEAPESVPDPDGTYRNQRPCAGRLWGYRPRQVAGDSSGPNPVSR